MSFEIVETDTDLQIKSDIQRFVDGDYIHILGKDQNDFALKFSFLFNHTIIEKNESTYDKLVFTYGDKNLSIVLDNSNITREEYFKHLMDEEFFQNSLKSFIRENRINKIIEND